MADFPPAILLGEEDSKHFGEGRIDSTMRKESDGGYTHTRPRYTRAPRVTLKTGFTLITQAQKNALDAFWASRVGGQTFTYDHPTTGVEYTVRFKGRYSENYEGKGPTFLWTVSNIELEQA